MHPPLDARQPLFIVPPVVQLAPARQCLLAVAS
ncbi:hypothetical protein Deiofobo_0405 [Pseudomonas phage Deifobo]|nr:hypothetical protein Deiofobo_0405 [Pseudomonas phage Deifobo]